jgi:hypothetical protein
MDVYSKYDLDGLGLPFPPNPRYRSPGNNRGDGLVHRLPERSYWQGSAAELVARRAGIHLTEDDWMPR